MYQSHRLPQGHSPGGGGHGPGPYRNDHHDLPADDGDDFDGSYRLEDDVYQNEPLNVAHRPPNHAEGGSNMAGGQNSANSYPDQNLPHHQQQPHHAHHNSSASLDTWDTAQNQDPGALFTILEEFIPKQNEPGRALTPTEMQQKREQAELVWERVRRWLWAHPQHETRQEAAFIRGQAEMTPLHLACKLHNPPDDVIQALIDAAAETASWADSHGWLPLHHACANGMAPEVLKILIDAYPAGKLQQDNQRRTPLHFYATRNTENPAAMTLNAQMLSDTGAAELADESGMLPMHYACAFGTHTAVLQVLAEVYPESLTAKERKGRTPMHFVMVNAHRDASPHVIEFLLNRPESKATIDARDDDGYLPLHLLALGLRGFRADDADKRGHVSQCLTRYLEAEPVATPDFLTAIQDLPDWLQDVAVVSRHVRNILNIKIVQRFPTSILMLDGTFLLSLIICFNKAGRNHIDIIYDPETTNDSQGALFMVFVGASYFLGRELVQIASLISLGSINNWWTDPTNWLDMSVIVLTFYYGVLMLNDSPAVGNSAFRTGVAFTQGILWLATMNFLKSTLVDFAVFVGGVFYVVRRLVAFLIAVGVILVAFAQMFYLVYVYTDLCTKGVDLSDDASAEDCTFAHCTFLGSFLRVYTMMSGQINGPERYFTNRAAEIIYVAYAFLVVILLSNVLIAIVTDSYDYIHNDRAAIVFWSNRLDFVAEMDAITFAVKSRIPFLRGSSKNDGQQSLGGGDAQEGPHGAAGNAAGEPVNVENGSTDYSRELWHQVMLLFDQNLYDDIDFIEVCVYNMFRIFCVFVVIPLWLALGLVTSGWLWPPQVREYLFVQKETAVSRAEQERQKLDQLKEIQSGLKTLKQEIMREIESDRDEMIRMKAEVETVQNEILSDLVQVKELMSSLLLE